MSDSPTPAAEAGHALVSAAPAATALDAHGHDPAAYEWVPVLRKPRKDGWTPQRQRTFIATLADCACVAQAAREAGMTTRSCYRLRRESPQFAAAWEAALAQGARHLVDLAFDRAIHGSDEPVFDKEGNRVGRRMRQNDRLLMFLLRAYLPDRFRHAHQSLRHPSEREPLAVPPVEEALRLLEPVAPPDPRKLMPPDELEAALQVADLMHGRLPRWQRGRGDAEYQPEPVDLEVERMLENARREGAGLPPVDGGWLPPGYLEMEADKAADDAFLA